MHVPIMVKFATSTNSYLALTQARIIKNKPIVNRDPQAAKLAEMQDEIQVCVK